MNFLKLSVVALVAAFGIASATFASDAAAPASKWRLAFMGHATDDGQFQFRVTPSAGEAILVTIKVNRGRGAFYLTKDALAAFKSQLPKARFRTEIVHGEELLVRSRAEEPAFLIEAVESTAPGAKATTTGE